ncbi:MAG: hypothetical protein PHQ14_10220, partial [Chromatiales bacterium]|nr:hypothetical protein [Chromatiales bacterium]
GNLQLEYAFVALKYPFVQNGSINPWENTLFPERLRAAVAEIGADPAQWDMQSYIREDNWSAAYAQRPGSPLDWDPGVNHPLRLLPGLDPADLPADADGFVRSDQAVNGHFQDGAGWITGWRAVNFMPYGIFTPHAGSVSGIYIRLPAAFMRDAGGSFDLTIYRANLDLVERAVQGRLETGDPAVYHGAAGAFPVERGLYPVGTEFAHPLHYVDVAADGRDATVSPFPGTRARRVKEVRYMYKYKPFYPDLVPPGNKSEDAPIRVSRSEGWVDNGAGWYLGGYIEDRDGALRPQTPNELTQCVGCHSGTVLQSEVGYADFSSGTGNTIDSTWSFPRKFGGDAGWMEMNYLDYRAFAQAAASATPGRAGMGDPKNRFEDRGEFRFFLEHVVGASLYGDMPAAMERHMAATIRGDRGYTGDWPVLDTTSAEALRDSQQLRLSLMREMTAKREHLDSDGTIHGALLYPPREDALAGAARYRQVVVTQRYDFGKDVFDTTPFTYRYHRTADTAFDHQDGTSYQYGEIITDRPIDGDQTSLTHGYGVGETLIDDTLDFDQGGNYHPDYVPLLTYPLTTE